MTSLTPTRCTPPHDTPSVRVLVPGLPVFAVDCTVEEAVLIEELLADLVWRQHRLAVGAVGPAKQGA
jgi:hypothetical protein